MARQRTVPELFVHEWEAWIADPLARLTCPVKGCGQTAQAYWNGVDETLTVTGCGHNVFVPEDAITWPPPEGTHVRRRNRG
jgi:hypothetical protein